MGCRPSKGEPVDATSPSARTQSVDDGGEPKAKFEEFPSVSQPSPAGNNEIESVDIGDAYNAPASTNTTKLQQVAKMVDLNTTIPEADEVEDVDIPKEQDLSLQTEDSYMEDQFNKQMTEFPITEEMKGNIDELIDKKVSEITNKTQYVILESTYSTLAGKKEGKTKTNQDAYFAHDSFGPYQNVLQLYGVCDGHGPSGHNVSQYCATHLPQILIKDKPRILTTLSKPGYALIKSFEELEEKLEAEKKAGKLTFDMSASGTTISCGLRVGNFLYLANLGDSRAVIGNYDDRTNKNTSTFSKIKVSSRDLTIDHDPKNQNEAKRIEQSKKGKLLVSEDGTSRIQINLVDDKLSKPRQSVLQLKQTYGVDALSKLNAISASVSRSIGDKLAHNYGGVISKPDVIIHKLNRDDLFVMWASDGIWTVIDNGDVTRIIGNKLKTCANEKVYGEFQKLSDKIVREAHIVWQDEFDDYVDDITAVIARIGTKELYQS